MKRISTGVVLVLALALAGTAAGAAPRAGGEVGLGEGLETAVVDAEAFVRVGDFYDEWFEWSSERRSELGDEYPTGEAHPFGATQALD